MGENDLFSWTVKNKLFPILKTCFEALCIILFSWVCFYIQHFWYIVTKLLDANLEYKCECVCMCVWKRDNFYQHTIWRGQKVKFIKMYSIAFQDLALLCRGFLKYIHTEITQKAKIYLKQLYTSLLKFNEIQYVSIIWREQ